MYVTQELIVFGLLKHQWKDKNKTVSKKQLAIETLEK